MLLTTLLLGLQGDVSCVYGGACNPCVPDVRKQYSELSTSASGKLAYHYGRGDRLPPFNVKIKRLGLTSHVQGFARIPGSDGENWFIASRSEANKDPDGAGFFLSKMADLNGHGGEALFPTDDSLPLRTPKERSARYFQSLKATDHASGLQPLGHIVALAAECSTDKVCRHQPAWVDFWDLHNPAQPVKLSRLVLDGTQGEPGQLPLNPNAAFIAVTRLADQRIIALIGGSGTRSAWLYVSDTPDLNARTRWQFAQYFALDTVPATLNGWDVMYQNMNFVNECGTGDVYLLGMGRDGLSRRLDLFKTTPATPQSPISFDRVGKKTLGAHALFHCNPRGGSSIHVTPSGKLVFYCAAKQGELLFDTHLFSEFTRP